MFATQYFKMAAVLNMPILALAEWMMDTAALQETHPFHRVNWSDWAPGPSAFRQHATVLTQAHEAAMNKDREMMRQLELAHQAALLAINMNATYIAMRSVHENDESLRHNVGYPPKEGTTRRSAGTRALKLTKMVMKVRKGPKSASVAITFTRDPAAGLYHLQMCKGKPNGEESWMDDGLHKSCRVVRSDLELASWYYYRGRSQGDNEAGPWSDPVGIIVT